MRKAVAVRVVVQHAGPDRVEELADLHRSSAIAGYGHIFPKDAPPPSREEVLAKWTGWLDDDADTRRRALIVERGDTVVGVVLAGPDALEPAVGHVARLYVAPALWGRGLGGALHTAAIGHLRECEFDEATLWVLEGNRRARSWYERLGWRPTGERKTVYAPAGIDDLRYRIGL
jgi:ribosomal protein S18 acetylase RimI-like enzyme